MKRHCEHTLLLIALLASATACSRKPAVDAASLRKGLEAYLAQRGDVCIAKQNWPIDVADADRAARTRDAVQLPVLERLGVVESHPIKIRTINEEDQPVVLSVTRYELTERGRQSYIDRRTRLPVAPRADGGHQADLCVVRVSLDKIVGWEAFPPSGPPARAVVSYTYTVDAVPWMRDPEALRVFPALARLIAGAGKAELKEGLALTASGWVANELLAPASSPPTVASQEGGQL
ncbi:MAG TPA: hypothetical protein VKQ32_15245 [Polyangia bacterium]|nr:hypothetical protein [Polyangia bacterium]